MARIDYHNIAKQIQSVLQNDATLSGVLVTVEKDVLLGFENTPWVNIRAARRDPTPEQPIRAGQLQKYWITYVCECWESSLEGPERAAQLRDDLIGKVEVALMGNRTLNDTVESLILDGGEFMLGEESGKIFVGGEVVVRVAATASV